MRTTRGGISKKTSFKKGEEAVALVSRGDANTSRENRY